MSRSKRKIEHIRHALQIGQHRLNGLDDLTFVHQSLPDCSVDQINLTTKIGELILSSPIFINAMTGGSGEATLLINQKLAIAARETNIPIAVGSQMSAIKDPSESKTFQIVRKENEEGIVFANLGSEATVDQARRAVEMIEADGLQIHLNTIQELTMPEGDRNFSGVLKRIETIINKVEVPVIVKEVGFGMSMETVKKLQSIGVNIVDVGGFGGTNFAKIENERRKDKMPYFDHWGIPTAASIIEAKHNNPKLTVLASGGIQHSIDVIKSLSLGASAAGLAGRFLKIVVEKGVESLINDIDSLKKEMKMIMTALGATTIEQLQQVPLIISGQTSHWLKERGIDTTQYSKRNH